MYEQVLTFNQSIAGAVPGDCLANVRKGYGIDSSSTYPDATASWSIDQVQHPDRNVPSGLYVPLYYSYMVNGVDEGHVNVQFPDGSVWSDGNKYASIDAYLANHDPIYLGWGEDVNGTKVIEGGNMPDPNDPTLMNNGDVINWYVNGWNRQPTQEELDTWVGQPWKNFIYPDVMNLLQSLNKDIANAGSSYTAYNGLQLYTKNS